MPFMAPGAKAGNEDSWLQLPKTLHSDCNIGNACRAICFRASSLFLSK